MFTIKELSHDDLIELVKHKNNEINRLVNIINKTISFIKERCIDDEFYINLSNKEKNIIALLTILENGGDF